MGKVLMITACIFAFMGADANAGMHYRGGYGNVDQWAARKDWGLHCAEYRNDPRCGGYGEQPMVRVAPQQGYGWYEYHEQGIIVVPQPRFREDWTTPAQRACRANYAKAHAPAFNPATGRWEQRQWLRPIVITLMGVSSTVRMPYRYAGPAYVFLDGINCYVEIDQGYYEQYLYPQIVSGDPVWWERANSYIQQAGRAQGLVPEIAAPIEEVE